MLIFHLKGGYDYAKISRESDERSLASALAPDEWAVAAALAPDERPLAPALAPKRLSGSPAQGRRG